MLLDIGPYTDSIVPDLMQIRLRQMGAWLHTPNGEAIDNTTCWTRDATDATVWFAPRSSQRPAVTVPAVPIRDGDTIGLLGLPGCALP